MRTEFVDRVEHLTELRSVLRSLLEGHNGQALVIDGVSGMGKSALLRAFQEDAARTFPADSYTVVAARCQPGIGAGLPYAPIVDLLLQLGEQRSAERPGRLRRLFSRTRQGVSRSAPDLLSAIVPGLGAVFTLGREITQASLASGSIPFDSLLPFQQGAAVRIVDALIDTVAQAAPTVLVIDDIQYADSSSLLVLDVLLRRLREHPIALIASHTVDGAHSNDSEETVEELLHRWATEGLLRRKSLTGLPHEAVAELVERRLPQAPPALPEQLARLTQGHAIFVTCCLDEWTPDDGEYVNLPESLTRVVEARLRRLTDSDRDLILIGATQGETFLSRTVAAVAERSHEEVMERLRRMALHNRLIIAEPLPPWASSEASDCYRFEHQALWGVVYAQQSAEQRRSRHARIAQALGGATNEAPRERRMEVARHLREGGIACSADSAAVHYGLARDAALHGLSFSEAEQLCMEAIAAARRIPERTAGREMRFVESVELLLSLTEVRWRGVANQEEEPDIDALAAEAESLASRFGTPQARIRATLLRGKTLLATQGLVPSLEKLRAAVDLAEEHGDPVALFVARIEYGRQVSKRRLADGLAQLREAERMYAREPRLETSDDPVLQHARNLGEMQLGISTYDSGYLDEALTRLQRCVQRLRGDTMKTELPIGLNYLAQVHLGLGSYREAEEVLREALAFERERGGDSGWHAYNAALLAQLLAHDAHRRDESLQLIVEAWAETERTWLVNLVPIVRNLYAEVLLLVSDSGALEDNRRLDEAYQLAAHTCTETRRSGMVRSEIAGHSLCSRALLCRGEAEAAEERAREAMRLLDEVGDMPALRSEEVQYYSAVVLSERGCVEEARELLTRARNTVMRKAGNIRDSAVRQRFLTQVRLNRAIHEGRGVA